MMGLIGRKVGMTQLFDDKGDIDRESFLVEVKGGKQVVVETLPPLNKK